jgi:hypothetical protein
MISTTCCVWHHVARSRWAEAAQYAPSGYAQVGLVDTGNLVRAMESTPGRVVFVKWAAHLLAESEGKRTGSAPGEPAIRADLPAGQLMAEARQFAADQGIASRKTGDAANPLFRRPSITEQAAPKDTLEKYTRADGTLTPERAALHKQIINGILAGHKPQEHSVATFFGGGPTAGKSTALKATLEDTAHIDSDEIKARLPEYQQMLDAKDPRAAAFVHEESSALGKQAVAEGTETAGELHPRRHRRKRQRAWASARLLSADTCPTSSGLAW